MKHYEILIGRKAGNTIVVEHGSVADIHAVIRFKQGMTEPFIR